MQDMHEYSMPKCKIWDGI